MYIFEAILVLTFLYAPGIAKKIASAGYGVFALDYPGFGLSEGLHGYIPSFDALVDDVIEHFSKIKGILLSASLRKFSKHFLQKKLFINVSYKYSGELLFSLAYYSSIRARSIVF